MYVIEMEGYNDGMPYTVEAFDDLDKARYNLMRQREANRKVRFRLIKIEWDWA